jgi:Cu-Zn family superoxide dismutase
LATFFELDGNGQIGISVSGLSPGRHGVHIHESGACTPPDFTSAGSHFNPASKQHGLENPEGPHAGDLPNLVVEADGSADTTFTVSASLLAQDSASMIGAQRRAFVIHADPDDQKTDPSGNSGSRVVCGVIERR